MQRKHFLLQSGKAALVTAFALQNAAALASHIAYIPNDQNTEQLVADLEKLIPALLTNANVPGFSIAVIQQGKLAWSRGFGVRDHLSAEPVNSNTIFEAASVSKTVFAYAVMKLCEKGIMGLDVPLSRYTTTPFLDGDPRLELITARYILSHRSGFQNWRTSDEPLKINFTPGTDFLYSGEGYYYLQSVITQLTGTVNTHACGTYEADLKVCATDIGDYLERNVLKPHGMRASGYVWTNAIGKNEAKAHDTDGKLISKPHQTATDMARYASAGGLLTSANDYARFLIGLFTPKENDPFLLNKNSMMEMVRPQVKLRQDQKIDGAGAWALGWAVQERENGNIILHSGGQTGFRSLVMASLKKKTGFVMLTNSDNGGSVLYNQELNNILDRLFA